MWIFAKGPVQNQRYDDFGLSLFIVRSEETHVTPQDCNIFRMLTVMNLSKLGLHDVSLFNCNTIYVCILDYLAEEDVNIKNL